ncbi:MAG: hypothetical protein JWP90_1743 [Mycetocola sp.]|jgi:hypothetical protein|nr:hypothetical protein [Mycetocola sp.]MCU1560790.1 hypothetical protein [Mycetocola sp.]
MSAGAKRLQTSGSSDAARLPRRIEIEISINLSSDQHHNIGSSRTLFEGHLGSEARAQELLHTSTNS